MTVITVSLEDQGVERREPDPLRERPQVTERVQSLRAVAKRAPRSKPNRGNDKDIMAWLLDHKRRTGCQKCGEKRVACLDFHHLDPSVKLFNVSNFRGREMHEVRREVDKCVLLCSNCHRLEHHDRVF